MAVVPYAVLFFTFIALSFAAEAPKTLRRQQKEALWKMGQDYYKGKKAAPICTTDCQTKSAFYCKGVADCDCQKSCEDVRVTCALEMCFGRVYKKLKDDSPASEVDPLFQQCLNDCPTTRVARPWYKPKVKAGAAQPPKF